MSTKEELEKLVELVSNLDSTIDYLYNDFVSEVEGHLDEAKSIVDDISEDDLTESGKQYLQQVDNVLDRVRLALEECSAKEEAECMPFAWDADDFLKVKNYAFTVESRNANFTEVGLSELKRRIELAVLNYQFLLGFTDGSASVEEIEDYDFD